MAAVDLEGRMADSSLATVMIPPSIDHPMVWQLGGVSKHVRTGVQVGPDTNGVYALPGHHERPLAYLLTLPDHNAEGDPSMWVGIAQLELTMPDIKVIPADWVERATTPNGFNSQLLRNIIGSTTDAKEYFSKLIGPDDVFATISVDQQTRLEFNARATHYEAFAKGVREYPVLETFEPDERPFLAIFKGGEMSSLGTRTNTTPVTTVTVKNTQRVRAVYVQVRHPQTHNLWRGLLSVGEPLRDTDGVSYELFEKTPLADSYARSIELGTDKLLQALQSRLGATVLTNPDQFVTSFHPIDKALTELLVPTTDGNYGRVIIDTRTHAKGPAVKTQRQHLYHQS